MDGFVPLTPRLVVAKLGTTPAFPRNMRGLALVFCLLAATACDEKSPTGPTIPLNQQFILAPGEAALVEGAEVRLQFVQVTGDSRCPADAICIQGGDAIVHVRVLDTGGSGTNYELHTGDAARAVVTHRQVRIELLELAPYPFSSRTISPGEYRATLMVRSP
jgi:hypothetical protein